jgi:hypothetical protein
MRPLPGTVLHFSEDPRIREFVPHVAPTSTNPEALVWAVDADRAPDYWFPRDCPRALAWVSATTTEADRVAILGPAVDRVHAIEYGWLSRLQTARLYAYAFDAADFAPYADDPTSHAHVARSPVRPLGPPEPVGDLLALHEEAGIELRLLPTLWPWWDEVIASTVGFSGIRLRNARPRPVPAGPID